MPYHYAIFGARIVVSTLRDGNMGIRGRRESWKNKMLFFRDNFRHNGINHSLISIWPDHGSKIKVVDRRSGGIIEKHDALITYDPAVVLAVDWADRFPVAIWDIKTKLKAVAHVGFRGAALGIVSLTIEKMVDLGAMVGDLHVFIGPGICQNCYDYGVEATKILSEEYHQHLQWDDIYERYYVDIVGIIFQQIVRHDLTLKNVINSNLCTFEDTGLFSARRQKPKSLSDLQAGVLMVGCN